ncbi:LapA family protein [Geminicoccus roseus]|uniref:LapA family protein n=1 Tax=Geminicoccus roseus TaxID=404900 RepID=UPI0004178EE0|nr:LapA family protein [Geminicoccus roseus]
MVKFLRTILGLIGLLVIVLFAIGNREPIEISLWPTPFMIDLPVYGVFLVAMILGVILGGIASWLGGHQKRAEASRSRRKLALMEEQEAKRRRDEEASAAALAAKNVTPTRALATAR